MTLEQLMAFTVSADHARQAQVWEAVKNSWNKEPYSIVCGVSDPLISPVPAVWRGCQNVFVIKRRFRWLTVGMDLLGVARLSNPGAGTGAGLMT